MSRAQKAPKPAPTMRKFFVQIEGTVEIEVADELLKTCNTDEWREQMFPFKRDEEFVEHIVYNTVLNSLPLRHIDGYADQPEERVRVIGGYPRDWEIEAEEIKPEKKEDTRVQR